MGFNLSEWALKNRSLTVYLMIIAVVAGLFAFVRLGRNEDPSFVIKTMVVQAAWPGATVDDMLKQVTERLERTLQETPNLDFLRSFTRAGVTTIFVNLKDSTRAREIPDIWYHVRKSIGDMRHTLPVGVVGPGFNDEFGDTFGIIYGFTADGFTHRELRDYVEDVRSKLLHVPDVSKIEILGAQDERIFVEFSMQELASLGIDRSALIAALQAQNVVRPAGTIQTGNESLSLRVSGAFRSEQDVANTTFSVGGRMLRLSDIAQVRRGFADPPQPLFRVNGQPAIGLAIAMREGGDILALGKNIKAALADATADLPVGIEPRLVADQAATVDVAISEFMTSLWQAIAIILAASFISLGIRPGFVIASAIPLTLVVVFSLMLMSHIDMQRISLGALIIALALMVDDAMTTTDAMLTRLAAGDDKVEAATFAFRTYAFAMLAGTMVTIAGFVPVGFAASGAGEYTFSLFAVVAMALIASWFVAVLFAPLLGIAILKPPKAAKSGRARLGLSFLPLFPHLGTAGQMADDRAYARDVRRVAICDPAHSQPVLPRLGPARTARRPDATAECFDLCQRDSGATNRRRPQRRSGCRALEYQRWTRRDPVLPAAKRATSKQLFQPGRCRGQGCGRAQSSTKEARRGAGQ